MSDKKTVGFVGVGNIGTPMVLSLMKGGFDVVVRDLRRDTAAECIAAGARFSADNRELAAACDRIGIAVVNDQQVSRLVTGEGGLLDHVRPGTILIIHSTIMPATARDVAAKAAEKGVVVLDAQISGGDLRARQGDLAIMVGGPAEAFSACSDYFDAVGRRAEHMGEQGAGAGTKICIQMMTFGNWIAAMESMRLAGALGINEQKLSNFATDTTAHSWVSETWGNYDRVLSQHTLAGTEELWRLFDKDLFNAVALGRELGILLPVTAVGSQALATLGKERVAKYAAAKAGKAA